MSTFQDIASDSLIAVGAVAMGESIPGETMQLALRTANRMLSSWNTRKLFIYTVAASKYTFTPPTKYYTIGQGAGADFVADRPTGAGVGNGIITANILIPNVGAPVTRFPLTLIDDQQWAAIPVIDIGSAIPLKLYNDGAYPNSTLYFWPYPNTAYGLELFTPQRLTQFPDIFTDFDFPDGYEKAIMLNLAIDLAPFFPKSSGLDPALVAMAREARVNIQSLNSAAPFIASDAPKMGKGHTTWNYRTGMSS